MSLRPLMVLIVALTVSGGVSACSCVEVGDAQAAPCAKISPTPVVFVGTVLEIDNPPYEVSTENPEVSQSRYRFQVDEEISGLKAEQQINIYSGRGGADCGYHFLKGKQYLVFPYRNNSGQLIATICSQTGPVNDSRFVLTELRAARDSDRVASVYGLLQVGQQPYLSVTDDRPQQPLRNARIELRNDNYVFTSSTDSNGAFSFYSVPAGAYHVRADLPPNMELARPTLKGPLPSVNLVAGDCAEYNIVALPTGRIRGKVVGPDHIPMKFAEVELFRSDKYQDSALLTEWREVQNQSGFFEFTHVSPGDYILVYNNEGPTTANSGPRCFYPGVPNISGAQRIHIEDGQQLLTADIHVRRKCLKQ